MKFSPAVGSVGWQHKSWLAGFYPDDMPEDWRLAYYANEFDTVLVPETMWIEKDSGLLTEWLDEVGESFSLFLECRLTGPEMPPLLLRFVEGKDMHHEQVGGLLVTVDDLAGDALPALLEADLSIPVYVDMRDSQLTPYGDHGKVSRVWRYDGDSWAGAGKTVVGKVECSRIGDDRELRQVLEAFASCGSAATRQGFLFFVGEPPDIGMLQRAKIVSQLL